MPERYTKLFSLTEKLYCPTAPVVISAGALLKDNEKGSVLGQFKFKNISQKCIKSLVISVRAFDTSGKEVEGIDEFQYLDLAVERDSEFGQKKAVPLVNPVTRSVKVRCIRAVFDNGEIWQEPDDAQWLPLPDLQTLESLLGNDLTQQYQRDTTKDSKYIPQEHSDLWICTCGSINQSDESICHGCRNSKHHIFEAMDQGDLILHHAEYLDEKEAQDLLDQQVKAVEKKRKQKIMMILGAIAIVFVLIAVLFGIRSSQKRSELLIPYKSGAEQFIENYVESVLDQNYVSEQAKKDALESLSFTYKDENINGDEFSFVVNCEFTFNGKAIPFTYTAEGNLNTNKLNLTKITTD